MLLFLMHLISLTLNFAIHIDFIKDFFSVDKHYTYPKIKIVRTPIVRLVGEGIGLTEGLLWKQKRNILNHILNF